MQIRTGQLHNRNAVLELDRNQFGAAERAAFVRRVLDEQIAVVAVDGEARRCGSRVPVLR